MTNLPDGYSLPTDAVTASRIERIVASCATRASSVVVAVKQDVEKYKAQAFVFWSDIDVCSPFEYGRVMERDTEQEAIERLESLVREYASSAVRAGRRDAATKRSEAATLLDEATDAEEKAATLERILEER